jgi:hypothetical protein
MFRICSSWSSKDLAPGLSSTTVNGCGKVGAGQPAGGELGNDRVMGKLDWFNQLSLKSARSFFSKS